MATYTRVSAGSIIPGADITAAPLNAEFNQLELAFGTGGHSHTGVAGDAPKIDLATSLSGFLPQVHGGSGGKNNFSATGDPTVANDLSQNYAVGSLWCNTSTGKVFVCVDNSSSAAIWKELGLSSLTGAVTLGDITATSFNGVVGNVTPAAGTFTTLASGAGVTATLPIVDIDGGAIDGVTIGANAQGDITGNLITANTNFAGNITGNVTGNVDGIVGGNTPAAGSFTGLTITSSGNIDLGNTTGAGAGTVTNLKTPSNDYDAATKKYVDDVVGGAPAALDTLNELAAAINDDSTFHTTVTTALGARIKTDGTNAMAADLDLGTNKVINVVDPVSAQDAATKNYVDTGFISNSGTSDQSLASNLNLAATKEITVQVDPSTANALTRKSYVDGIAGSATAAQNSADDAGKYATHPHNQTFTLSDGVTTGQSALHYHTEISNITSTSAWTNVSNAATSGHLSQISGEISPTNNIATVAGDSAVIQTVAGMSNAINHFAQTYFIAPDNTPPSTNVTPGDLWYKETTNGLFVYDGNSWVSVGASVSGIEQSEEFVVGTDKTANNGVQYDGDSGTNANWNNTFPCTYTSGATTAESQVHVYLNGTKLAHSEYTATNGSTIVLGSNANASDVVSIVSFGSFTLGNVYTKTQSDATFMPKAGGVFAGTVTIPDLVVTGTTTSVNTTNTNIADNIITLNSGEQGAGVGGGTGTSGIHVERGTTTPNASIIFDENNDHWVAGLAGSESQILTSQSENWTMGGTSLPDGNAVIQADGSDTKEINVGTVNERYFTVVNGATGYNSQTQATANLTVPMDRGSWIRIVSNNSHQITFTGGTQTGFLRTFTLEICNTATTGTQIYTFAPGMQMQWANGAAPAWPAPGKTNIYTFTMIPNPNPSGTGTVYYGSLAMGDIPNV